MDDGFFYKNTNMDMTVTRAVYKRSKTHTDNVFSQIKNELGLAHKVPY